MHELGISIKGATALPFCTISVWAEVDACPSKVFISNEHQVASGACGSRCFFEKDLPNPQTG